MDQGIATIVAAVIGLAAASLTGLAGVAIGAGISARAARESALATKQVADADREEVRAARFADRVRELAICIAQAADATLDGVDAEVFSRQKGNTPTDVTVLMPPDWGRWVRELRLVSRRPDTRMATNALDDAMDSVLGFTIQGEKGGSRPIPSNAPGWDAAYEAGRVALEAFEDAIRAELGVVQVRPPK
jgi:hypothetical protein